MTSTDDARNALARALQDAVPLLARPFHALAERLGTSEKRVMGQLRDWSAEGKLREISGVLEGAALGHDSALACGTVPEEDLDRVVAVVNAHPMVTHDYLRDHRLNLWFTIAVPPEMGLETTLAILAREAGVSRFHALRRTATFKIGVKFDLASRRNETAAAEMRAVPEFRPTAREILLLRALQAPLPLVDRPFAELALERGLDEDELLDFGRRHLGGVLRRYVGTFRHRKLGVRANGMVVWRVAGDEIAAAGRTLAAAPEVSHCYARNAIPGFPYTLYSMVHGPDEASCHRVARRLSEETGITEYAVLFSLREFRKVRLRYFLPELDRWWREHGAGGEEARDG